MIACGVMSPCARSSPIGDERTRRILNITDSGPPILNDSLTMLVLVVAYMVMMAFLVISVETWYWKVR